MSELGDKIRALKPGIGIKHTGSEALDQAAALADEHAATIAAAYEAAATITDGELVYYGHFVRWPCYHKGPGNVHIDSPHVELARCFSAAIRAMPPADAAAALNRIKREARKEEWDAIADVAIKGLSAHFPGMVYGGNYQAIKAAIIAAAEKEAGNG